MRKRSTGAALAVVVATTLAGCLGLGDTTEPAYLINESGATLAVSVSMPRTVVGSEGRLSACRFDPSADPMLIGTAKDAYARRFDSRQPVVLANYDPDKCNATITVPPDMALLMFWNGSCNDYKKYLSNPQYSPTMDRLSVTGGGRSILLTGFDTAKAFKVSASSSDCRFVIK